jgi:hypothetical protein
MKILPILHLVRFYRRTFDSAYQPGGSAVAGGKFPQNAGNHRETNIVRRLVFHIGCFLFSSEALSFHDRFLLWNNSKIFNNPNKTSNTIASFSAGPRSKNANTTVIISFLS